MRRKTERSSSLFSGRSLPGPVYEALFDHQEQDVEPVAERAGGEDRRIHVRHVEQLLRLEHAEAEPVDRTDEHFRDDDDDKRERHAVAQADEGLRQRLHQDHVLHHPPARCAHHPRGEDAGLACVHHAVGDVEQDDQRRAKRGDVDLGGVADAEDHQKQREQRGGRRRAEEIDDELDRAIDPLAGAEHDAERNGDDAGDRGRGKGADHRLPEVVEQAAAGKAIPQRLERRMRRRQQHGIDDPRPVADVPDGDQAEDADQRQQPIRGRETDDAIHDLRTSRWNVSRQRPLSSTKSGSDSVEGWRGRAIGTSGKSAILAGRRDSSST